MGNRLHLPTVANRQIRPNPLSVHVIHKRYGNGLFQMKQEIIFSNKTSTSPEIIHRHRTLES